MNLEEADVRPRFEDPAVMFGFKPNPGALRQPPVGIERI
jgi:hypothetical protein